jgi:phosphoglycerol transferase MdoB-like AlkP superfamily enzyme
MKSLYSIIFPSDPALWACPFQNGVYYYFDLIFNALYIIAAIIFVFGIVSASISYLTAFGSEEKAKKGRETLKWSFIGAVVIMLSVPLISIVTNLFLAQGNGQNLVNKEVAAQCKPSTAP